MLDIRLIRENPEAVKQRLSIRNKDYSGDIDEIVSLDKERRLIMTKMEQIKSEQNAFSKKIPALKKQGEDVAPILAEMKEKSDLVARLDEEVRALEEKQSERLYSIPNLPREDTPPGVDSEANPVVRQWGEPPVFAFEPRAHWDIGEALGLFSPARAAKVTGARFHFYQGLGARLERAIVNLFLDTHTANGYTEVFPPFLVNRAAMTGTGQLPKFEEDAFKISGIDYFLVPTAEVPVTNMHRDEVLSAETLPLHYCAYSACFRAEAGSAGRDTRGLIRQHQFNKVELVKFTTPDRSMEELESLTQEAEQVLQILGLPYRVVRLCGGDLSFTSAITYDIEVWMPSYARYVEISSCSNFETFQARRANIRYKVGNEKPQFVHTLNGSGVAVGRTVAAILEGYQQADTSVIVPEALQSYLGARVIQ